MQTTFPTAAGYAGKLVVGVHMGAGGAERVGTVVLKRTYAVDAATGTLTPAASALPVLDRDQPYNLALNTDFEMPQPKPTETWSAAKLDAWAPEAPPPAREQLAGVLPADAPDATPEAAAAKVRAASAAGSGRLVQELELDAPLAGRTFTLSVHAKADAAPATASIRLEDPTDGAVLCENVVALGASLQRVIATGTPPVTVTGKQVRIVLSPPTDAARTAYYDRVQLEERAAPTRWDLETVLRYEHDLAPRKPEGDVIVLGYTDASYPPPPAFPPGATASIHCTVRVDGAAWLERDVHLDAGGRVEKALFGWQPRAEPPRKGEGGTWPAPAGEALPADFDDLFFDGFLRAAAVPAARPFPFLPPSAEVRIQRDTSPASPDYVVRLRGDAASAAYAVHDDGAPDVSAHWRRVPVPMQLDTLVVEPDLNRCHAVWRGAWPFDAHPADAYRLLAVDASA